MSIKVLYLKEMLNSQEAKSYLEHLISQEIKKEDFQFLIFNQYLPIYINKKLFDYKQPYALTEIKGLLTLAVNDMPEPNLEDFKNNYEYQEALNWWGAGFDCLNPTHISFKRIEVETLADKLNKPVNKISQCTTTQTSSSLYLMLAKAYEYFSKPNPSRNTQELFFSEVIEEKDVRGLSKSTYQKTIKEAKKLLKEARDNKET